MSLFYLINESRYVLLVEKYSWLKVKQNEFIVFEKPEMNSWHKRHKSITMGKEYNLISDCWSVIDILLEDK